MVIFVSVRLDAHINYASLSQMPAICLFVLNVRAQIDNGPKVAKQFVVIV